MRSAAVFAAAALVAPLALWAAGTAAADSEAPDLSKFEAAPIERYLDTSANGGEVYFQTPDGLLCAMRPGQGRAGCDGPLPGVATAANEIVLSGDQYSRGLRATASPQFVKPTGGAARVLEVGHKITFADFECAVDEGPKTLCTKGDPVSAWMTISADGTAVGPRTAGLPDDVVDPNDFVGSDDSYLVGIGPKNMFPVFTVAGGLTCKIGMFSGGEIACNGELPGLGNGDDEVFVRAPGPVGTRKAGNPPFSTPMYPGPVRELPAGHRIDANGGTCMALDDGGVACIATVGGPPQGFVVTDDEVRTF
ncbi:hypothetical protein [[Mycobacterium] wendilense]|uniref:Secreted protein n=1 Tax=[Mycobacterium] wendilense TaxID=3064284 RepID=A0ABN9P700_9MYCO|nr:hypothetical protein [Mycolicibacterium sp. MU0050]CAJ1585688.1 hypothetical protein MU0050_003857 [Mycolicibacterium sp. MU0050]